MESNKVSNLHRIGPSTDDTNRNVVNECISIKIVLDPRFIHKQIILSDGRVVRVSRIVELGNSEMYDSYLFHDNGNFSIVVKNPIFNAYQVTLNLGHVELTN